ncbi:hypothetical protein DIPPA_25027 [Diplonema papillatum]|nr:hypothetical protein DIPPA_65171 [Diplonema papillatum]KAJ9439192.1 hypothetical protein DIPPA_25027 [Diplonema papillatum]
MLRRERDVQDIQAKATVFMEKRDKDRRSIIPRILFTKKKEKSSAVRRREKYEITDYIAKRECSLKPKADVVLSQSCYRSPEPKFLQHLNKAPPVLNMTLLEDERLPLWSSFPTTNLWCPRKKKARTIRTAPKAEPLGDEFDLSSLQTRRIIVPGRLLNAQARLL